MAELLEMDERRTQRSTTAWDEADSVGGKRERAGMVIFDRREIVKRLMKTLQLIIP